MARPRAAYPGMPVAPTPPARSSKKGLWIALAALVVVGAGVAAAVVLLGGDDEETGPPANMAAAAAGLAGAIADAEVDADNPFVETEECLVPLHTISGTAPSGADISTMVTADDPFSAIIRSSEGSIISIECSAGIEGTTTLLGIAVASLSSGSAEDATREYLDTFTFEFQAQEPYRGGMLLSYCGTPGPDSGEAALSFCETDWIGDGVMVGIFADPDTATPAQVEEWVKAALDDLIDKVADEDITSTTTG